MRTGVPMGVSAMLATKRIRMRTAHLRRLKSGLLVALGYILSPLSWWNDAVVNLPIAYAVGSLVSWVWPRLFLPAMITAYWMTNALGLLLIHRGAEDLLRQTKPRPKRREWLLNLLVSCFYTALVAALVLGGILKPPSFR
jgi:hypothetical protein